MANLFPGGGWRVAGGWSRHPPPATLSFLCPRMRLVVAVAQPVGGHVRVNLRVGETAMAEQFLHAADVGAAIQQVSCKAVAERVRARARIEPRLGEILLEQPADAA